MKVHNKFWANVRKKNYNSLTGIESSEIRGFYKKSLGWVPNIEDRIKTSLILTGFERVVVGDHGTYVEFKKEQLRCELYVPDNQKYRLESKWKEQVSYLWAETTIGGCKVYYQLKTVKYADYKVNMYYISIWDVLAFSAS